MDPGGDAVLPVISRRRGETSATPDHVESGQASACTGRAARSTDPGKQQILRRQQRRLLNTLGRRRSLAAHTLSRMVDATILPGLGSIMNDAPEPPDNPFAKTLLLFAVTVVVIAVSAYILIRME